MSVGIAVAGSLEEVVRGEADADFVSSNRLDHGRDNLECEATPVLNRSTVLIGAGVDVVVQELLQQISVGSYARVIKVSSRSVKGRA